MLIKIRETRVYFQNTDFGRCFRYSAIRGTWSVRELQRQIDSNYYFRSGWSQKPEALAKLVEGKAETDTLALDIKSPFTFEFLGLQACLLSQEYHAARW